MKLIDTHSHLYAEEFDADREEVLARAREHGVERLLLPAIDGESYQRMFDLVQTAPDICRPMMGLHPTSVNENPRWREELSLVERYFAEPPAGMEFCAVGEIGLDYYWSRDFVAQQREAFIEQCRLAARLDLPVAIHTRAAWEDMCEILEAECRRAEQQGQRLRGVLHAFSEDAATYRHLRECGDWLFGVGGVVTFKKSLLAEAVAEMALEDIVLETDCPYLTPVPYRGQRNESAYVSYVCEKVAQIKGVSAEQVASVTSENARRMFLPMEMI
ncbi:MAG: TatD family hydrolase [Alistipes sp.]|nr:TatD family hydrolase [Alistipes sp.]